MGGDNYKLPLVIGAVALEKWCLLEKSMDGDVCWKESSWQQSKTMESLEWYPIIVSLILQFLQFAGANAEKSAAVPAPTKEMGVLF